MTQYGELIYTTEDGVEQRFALRLGDNTIGRDSSERRNHLMLAAGTVSGLHARILCTQTGCRITDVSRNGTLLNGKRLPRNEEHPLHDGDTLKIGPYLLRYMRATTNTPIALSQQASQAEALAIIAPHSGSSRSIIITESASTTQPHHVAAPPLRKEHSSYMQYLPPCYHVDQDGQPNMFLHGFLLIFESFLEPIEQLLDQIHYHFHPWLTPESLLPWLASWVSLTLDETWPVERRRALISMAAELYRWRGTRHGLSEYIHIYTGITPTIIEPGQEQHAGIAPLGEHQFGVLLEAANPEQMRPLVAQIIEAQKPAHTAYILTIRQPS